MNHHQIPSIIYEAAFRSRHTFDAEMLKDAELQKRSYRPEEFDEFKLALIETGTKVQLLFMEYILPPADFAKFVEEESVLAVVFQKTEGDFRPLLIDCSASRKDLKVFDIVEKTEAPFSSYDLSSFLSNESGDVVFFVVFPYKSLISEYSVERDLQGKQMSPVRRFFRLLSTEKKDIGYILFYSVVIGLLSLVLPLGIQTTVELISGGVFFSSVYVLIGIVIAGVLLAGALQIVQITLVEYLQRRIFTKASIEFAFRIPKIKMEAILGNYAPELVNRFFDILSLQKGLPKLLIDLSSGAIQIFFGLLLLSLYHPFFVFFGLLLVAFLFLIFFLTGPLGLESSIQESKYKYRVAHWLEELARALYSFKMAGHTDLPIRKTDYAVNNYLKYRKKHFDVLVTQFSFIILFKGAVTGALLIMGAILVVDREITLGQFVAAEVIIILILAAVEKVIMYLDVVYDLFTAVDKISHVTDLPLEKIGGINFPVERIKDGTGYSVQVKNLHYRFDGQPNYVLKGVSFSISSGEKVCIAGPGGSGKTTLTNILSGIFTEYEGMVAINNYSIRDLNLADLRDKIAKNISAEDIFDGTILENIIIGKPMESIEDAIEALKAVGADEAVNALPDGLHTHVLSGGKGFSSSLIHKIILARCYAKHPRIIILNDFFNGVDKQDKLFQMQSLTAPESKWTLIAVSNDPLVMAACDRVIVLEEGAVKAEGTFKALFSQGILSNYLDQ